MHKWYVNDAPFTSLWNSTNITGVHKFSKNLQPPQNYTDRSET